MSEAAAISPIRRQAALGVALLTLVSPLVALLGVLLAGPSAESVLVPVAAELAWARPVVAVLADLAGALVLGCLTLAAWVLPRAPLTPERRTAWHTATFAAAAAATAWALLTGARLVLTYVALAGVHPTDPTFGGNFVLFATTVSIGRTLLALSVIAAVIAPLALLVARPAGALLTALLGVAALWLQAQTGHSASSGSHDLAVGSMFLHLLGASLWVGGLGALAVVARGLQRDLGVVVARFSPIAAWSLAAVAVSGAVSAGLQIGGPADLTTRYGGLVLAKVAAFALLGLVGWQQRRRVIARIDAGTAVPKALGRLLVVELALMGAVYGLAVTLAASPPPASAEPAALMTAAERVTGHALPPEPTPLLWLTSFRWDLLPAVAAVAGLVMYVRWVARLRARGDSWPWHRTASAVAGLMVLMWATSGGPAVYGHVLFSAHMVQHMLLLMVAPILLALSAPVTLASRALPVRRDGSAGPREWLLAVVHSRLGRFAAHPIVAAINFVASMFAFYYSGAFEWALTSATGHLLMVVHFSATGYFFANALIGLDPSPSRPSYPVRLLMLFSTMAFHAFFGVSLASLETVLVPDWFAALDRPWGSSALADQRTGAAIAWGVSELPMLVLAIVLARGWTRDDERAARRRDRAADRDGDRELEEYNALLARLAQDRRSVPAEPGSSGSDAPQ